MSDTLRRAHNPSTFRVFFSLPKHQNAEDTCVDKFNFN